jgi:hypothetical protein
MPTSISNAKKFIRSVKSEGGVNRLDALLDSCLEFGSVARSRIKIITITHPSGFTTHQAHIGDSQRHIGTIGVEPSGEVKWSGIREKFQKMGLGKKLYGEAMRRRPQGIMSSDKEEISQAAKGVWKSMYKKPRSYRVSEDKSGNFTAQIHPKALIK